MRKFLVIAIPILTLILFILIMLSGNHLKKSLVENNNIPDQIQVIEGYINKEEWQEVSKETKKLEEIWQKIVVIVQFSSERNEINAFTINLARLRGAIRAKDKSSALIELNEAYEHWKDLGK
ncbi:MAG: DUF4363 family protein [Clostridiales bacterium]|nr:DUF4363 family protein [Clostridiales bacterium]